MHRYRDLLGQSIDDRGSSQAMVPVPSPHPGTSHTRSSGGAHRGHHHPHGSEVDTSHAHTIHGGSGGVVFSQVISRRGSTSSALDFSLRHLASVVKFEIVVSICSWSAPGGAIIDNISRVGYRRRRERLPWRARSLQHGRGTFLWAQRGVDYGWGGSWWR